MSLKWENLVPQGRARDYGIPWTAEELELVLEITRKDSIPMSQAAEYVRRGVKSFEEYKGFTESIETRQEIEEEAKKLKIVFALETPTSVLEREIERVKKVRANKEKEEEIEPEVPSVSEDSEKVEPEVPKELTARERVEMKATELGIESTVDTSTNTLKKMIRDKAKIPV